MKKILTIISVFFFITTSYAQTYKDCVGPLWYFQNSGSIDGALANNTTSNATGISTLASNPAALGLINNSIISFSLQSNYFTQNAKLTGNNYNSNSLNNSYFDGMGFVYPIPVYSGSMVMGLSYTQSAIYNNLVDAEGTIGFSEDAWEFQQRIEETGVLNSLRLGGAVEFQRNLFLGLTLNYYSGYRNYDYWSFDFDKFNNWDYKDFTRIKSINPDYTGLNFNIGFLYRTGVLNIGANFSTPFTLKTDEEFEYREIETYDSFEPYDSTSRQNRQYDIKSPAIFSGGITMNLGKLELSLDMKMQNWHNMKFESNLEDTDGNFTDSRINQNIRKNLKSTTDYGIGLSTPINKEILLNMGYRVISRPFYDLPDNERQVHLAGIGVQTQILSVLSLGITYQTELGKQTFEDTYFDTSVFQKYQNHKIIFSTSLIL